MVMEKSKPSELRENFQHSPGDLELLFRRLIGIGGRTQGDGQALVLALAEFGAQPVPAPRLWRRSSAQSPCRPTSP